MFAERKPVNVFFYLDFDSNESRCYAKHTKLREGNNLGWIPAEF